MQKSSFTRLVSKNSNHSFFSAFFIRGPQDGFSNADASGKWPKQGQFIRIILVSGEASICWNKIQWTCESVNNDVPTFFFDRISCFKINFSSAKCYFFSDTVNTVIQNLTRCKWFKKWYSESKASTSTSVSSDWGCSSGKFKFTTFIL